VEQKFPDLEEDDTQLSTAHSLCTKGNKEYVRRIDEEEVLRKEESRMFVRQY
jgi:hypothetical protein